ncbi:hypothetical protein BO79DRAFT_222952 [Aspergillus costaricaensis CBS 115574]|uniref:Uncharacterized protein n=1 Tax=Aspergillus costaricaensis CBS 115574 TaxID=1448317 RepID=A0ACD1HXX3_9EURO|nr:hypothetical protein BO79DRAFT_222952 [Aspergillus costaricaensis CBS 115574]RAK82982.1 hypothetical protein BO79DRAFT_222952 [Aspergillus costaricaensis CBS 115574]
MNLVVVVRKGYSQAKIEIQKISILRSFIHRHNPSPSSSSSSSSSSHLNRPHPCRASSLSSSKQAGLTLYLFLGILPNTTDQHKTPLAADHTAHTRLPEAYLSDANASAPIAQSGNAPGRSTYPA